MTTKTRLIVFLVSVPVIAFTVIGGFLGSAMARDDTYQQLRIFQDVVSLIANNYVEETDLDHVMAGGMRGVAENLDPDSAYLPADAVRAFESEDELPAGETGLEITRQYYLRVVSARDGSPAARAGIRPGDLIRVIDQTPTRDMSAFEGRRLLRGEPGSTVTLTVIRDSQVDPHVVQLTRERLTMPSVRGRVQQPGVGYVRIADFQPRVAADLQTQLEDLTRQGATSTVIDLRGTSTGTYEEAIAAARLFVSSGTLALRESRGRENEAIAAGADDGHFTLPIALLTDIGTSGPAEIFAAALDAADRSTQIGQRTLGRVTQQKLVKLPDGSGFWLTSARYLQPSGEPLEGLAPDVSVPQPDLEFGDPLPTSDETLQRATEWLTRRAAA